MAKVKKVKLKTKRGAVKRLRETATGFKHAGAGRRHILTKKTTKRKRQMRGANQHAVADSDCRSVARMLCVSHIK